MKLKDTCSLEEKLTDLDSIKKQRCVTLPTKVRLVKPMVFPCLDVSTGPQMNCGIGEDSCESLGLLGGQTSQP